ncbi:MAG TPA: alkaline phosphatase family protein, partial [Thermoanaerobaculia bacterium]|nr:alkaline phosphatase family protein [Thermoanaerobaculia bacterium]
MASPALASAAAPAQPVATAAAAAPTVRPAVLRPTLLATAVGGAQGALLYGGTIGLLHALHNRLGVWDALVLLLWTLVMYGVGGAVASGLSMLVLRWLRRLRRPVAALATAGLRRDLWVATAAFHFVFWLFTASYGLTYDEAPRWVTSATPMLTFLVLRSLGVLLGTAAAAWLLLALGAALARRRRLGLVLAALAALLLVAQVGVALTHPVAAPERPALPSGFGAPTGVKVAVVGVDGADWRVALPLVRAGQLPHLARLMAEGTWGPLTTFHGSNSAVIWASIYSGRVPATHGIFDFYRIRLAGMSDAFDGVYPVHRTFLKEVALRLQRLGLAAVNPIDRTHVRSPLIWEVARAAGRSVGVIDGYYYSYPAPQLGDTRSFFLGYGSDGLWQQTRRAGRVPTAAEAALQAWPPELLAREGRFLGLPDFTWQGAATLDLLGRYPQPDLLSVYSHQPDAVQHVSWHNYEPGRYFGVDRGRAARRDGIVPFYRVLDAYLGRLQARLQPGTVLVVVSDHGHSPTLFHAMDTQHWHGPPGILLLHGGPVRAGRLPAAANVLDVYPTLLYLLGIPQPDDADGRLLAGVVDPAWLRAHPPQHVASWDGLPPPRTAAPPDAERRRQELE